MLGQLVRNRADPLDRPGRTGRARDATSSVELLLQPRFRLADHALVALQASGTRSRPGSGRNRLLPPGKELRDICRDGVLLRHACRVVAGGAGQPAPTLSLRISEAQAASGMLAGLIGEVLRESMLPPERLELEFCEYSLQADEADMLYTLAGLRDLGVGLVMGGFGGGISSLTLLRRRSLAGLLSGLKLDELLVHEQVNGRPGNDPGDGFLGGLIASAHALGLVVLAQGLESESQHRQLLTCGCDQGSGSWLGSSQLIDAPRTNWMEWSSGRSQFASGG